MKKYKESDVATTKNAGSNTPAPGFDTVQSVPKRTPEEMRSSVNESISQAVTIYADSLIQIGAGPFVSRFSLGTQNPNDGKISSAVNIVMPTNAVLDLCTQILALYGTTATADSFDGSFDPFIERLRKLAKSIEPN
ncbi:hypothetical protein [Rhodanobacter sp. L36]|uniref:hypothetical protein n=1 Tax=Rhodanobacter sp. L36 TaxID=1747221 RepID=UPI001C20B3C0|nr:hypothetical protein [Rhodanobacter sp. L36]